MASYLVPSASTLSEGTDSNDTFLVQTALQNTVKGGAGNDVISAEENNVGSWTQALINGNDGNDTITFSAGTGANASILGGAGNDLLSAEGVTLTSTLFQAGGGTDSLNLSAGTYAAGATIAGNAGADLISAEAATNVSTSEILLGAGADTLKFSGDITATTINGGGGADLISANFSATGPVVIQGDTIGSEFYGNDTLLLSAISAGTALIQGAGGADVISASITQNSTGSTVNGNYGKDSVVLSAAGSNSAEYFVAGGAGADTITVQGVTTAVTSVADVRGGGGNDLITVNAVGATAEAAYTTAVEVQGGAGSDTILLDVIPVTGAASSISLGSVRYDDFTESNLSSTDTVSAFAAAPGTDATTGGILFNQDVVSAFRLTSVEGNTNFSATNGVVTWLGDDADITARAEVLDGALGQGATTTLTNLGGTSFLFVQGGSAGGGTDDDLIVKLGNGVSAVAVAGGTAITISIS